MIGILLTLNMQVYLDKGKRSDLLTEPQYHRIWVLERILDCCHVATDLA